MLFLALSHHCGAENEVQRKPSLFRCCFSVEVVLQLEKKKTKKHTLWLLLLSHPLLFFSKSKNLSRCMWLYGADSYWVGNWMQCVICKLNKQKTCSPFSDKGFIFYLNLTSAQAATHFSSYPSYNMLTHWITVIVKSSHFFIDINFPTHLFLGELLFPTTCLQSFSSGFCSFSLNIWRLDYFKYLIK